MWLVLIERSFQGLLGTIETMRIIEELMEIWLNEVCDREEGYLDVFKDNYLIVYYLNNLGNLVLTTAIAYNCCNLEHSTHWCFDDFPVWTLVYSPYHSLEWYANLFSDLVHVQSQPSTEQQKTWLDDHMWRKVHCHSCAMNQ